MPEAYSPTGQNLFPLSELLNPLHAAAYRCALPWVEPFLLYKAGKLDEAALAGAARDYIQVLRELAAETQQQRWRPETPTLRPLLRWLQGSNTVAL